jgi:hypothetical protein
VTWEQALANGWVYNATEGCKKMGCKPTDLESKYWCKLKKDVNLLKVGALSAVRSNVSLHAVDVTILR